MDSTEPPQIKEKPPIKEKADSLKPDRKFAIETNLIAQRLQAIPPRLLLRLVMTEFNTKAQQNSSDRLVPVTDESDNYTLDQTSELNVAKSANLWSGFINLLEFNQQNFDGQVPIPILSEQLLKLWLSTNALLKPKTLADYLHVYPQVLAHNGLEQGFDEELEHNLLRTTPIMHALSREFFTAKHFYSAARLHSTFVSYLSQHKETTANQLGEKLKHHTMVERQRLVSYATDDDPYLNHKYGSTDPAQIWTAEQDFPKELDAEPSSDRFVVHSYPVELILDSMMYLLQMTLTQLIESDSPFAVLADFRLHSEFLLHPLQSDKFPSLNLITSFLTILTNDYPILFRDQPFGHSNFAHLVNPELLASRLDNGATEVYSLVADDQPLPERATLYYPSPGGANTRTTATLLTDDKPLEQAITSALQQHFAPISDQLETLTVSTMEQGQ
ncbi:hypothetical protein PAHA111176_05530 [Parendozoicomonas haliclonae]|uniref:Uncharacterized protein n=2 Tax=Parendozoicomonas haliclonae TaxID=1960125 RepID=A0A1X7AKS3_9GAMM|nr:hypothetical protein EHSB41UT_02468 [Parendozoicomonas haliclonae]